MKILQKKFIWMESYIFIKSSVSIIPIIDYGQKERMN